MPKNKNKEDVNSTGNNDVAAVENSGIEKAKEPEKFNIVFSWKTVDFIKNPQTKLYFTAAVIGSMGMIIWGILSGSLTMIFLFIMIAVLSIIVLNEESQEISVRIDEKGVNLNNEHFNFKDFVSFKISQMHGLPLLSLYRKEKYLPAKMIYVQEEPVGDLRDFLEIYLPEEE